MPELPEVETVRRGLADRVVGRELGAPVVAHPRAVRRQEGGAALFSSRATGVVHSARRRGKYLWLEVGDRDDVVVAHLGMSGQFRVVDAPPDDDPHARVWWPLDDGTTVVFRDQRTFGWVLADRMAGEVPTAVAHIARDPFDPAFDREATARAIRRSTSGVKRVLLNQSVVSGIGNIYADETLWRVGTHPDRPASRLTQKDAIRLLDTATEVMDEALAAGGTSFDPLYVAVNGESGWFERRLDAYGRQDLPCRRCGTAIVREQFANRSSHRCPRCQRPPRGGG